MSERLCRQWAVMLAAFWWGSLLLLMAVVVPLLFKHAPTPAIAGSLVAKLFSAQAWLAQLCGVLVMVLGLERLTRQPYAWFRAGFVWVILAMLMALLVEFAVAPRILARDNLRLWHTLGSTMLVGQLMATGRLLWQWSARA